MITTRQRDLVRGTWQQILPVQAAASAIFYDRLFRLDPTLRPLFPTDLKGQRVKLMGALDFIVGNLGDPERLVPVLEDLGRGHRRFGLAAKDFDLVGEALMWALKQGLGTAFTPEVREAWATAYALVADIMLAAMEEAIA
ncbi:MAG: globin family protein [Holophagaceae bacterium]